MMKESLLDQSMISAKSGSKRPKRFHHEITMVRRLFRLEGNLMNYNNENEILTSLNGQYLDHSLCDFNCNYEKYKNEYKKNGTYGKLELEPIFFTEEERIEYSKIENKTIKEITYAYPYSDTRT